MSKPQRKIQFGDGGIVGFDKGSFGTGILVKFLVRTMTGMQASPYTDNTHAEDSIHADGKLANTLTMSFYTYLGWQEMRHSALYHSSLYSS